MASFDGDSESRFPASFDEQEFVTRTTDDFEDLIPHPEHGVREFFGFVRYELYPVFSERASAVPVVLRNGRFFRSAASRMPDDAEVHPEHRFLELAARQLLFGGIRKQIEDPHHVGSGEVVAAERRLLFF